ncbi:MAG TPA: alpha-glucan family phosphorylase, partial [Bacteroidetes bacterium]|nr:alpha-glucan family phosphorylase [Bacteroidota bacterium]
EFNIKKQLSRNKLKEVSEAVLGYEISENPFYILNSGRYEFKNKGIDVFIKSLADLNKENPDREIIAIIAVPAGTKGVNHVVKQRLNGQKTDDTTSFFCTHELFYPDSDPVLSLLKQLGMRNSEEDKVKIIFVPVYLNGNDGIFDIKYYDFLLGFHFTAFPSYYEPWGYTPMESLAFHVPTVTTSLAGFGAWIKAKLDSENKGAFVIERTDDNDEEVVSELTKIIRDFSSLPADKFMMSCIRAFDLSKLALWKNLISNYSKAYDFADSKAEIRKENIDEYVDYKYEGIKFEELDSRQPNWKKIFIKPDLPENISFLEKLSKNLWWTWNKKAEALFKYINIDLWEKVEHNPVTLLEKLDIRMLKKLSKDEIFLKNLHDVEKEFRTYMSAEKPKDIIAYFSMEFGLHDTLKIFSGGLGILAGDYMKEASDSNYNMVGIGLLYRFGYFKQKITLLGDQISTLTPQRFTHLPILPVRNKEGERLKVRISLPGRILVAQAWKVYVGRNVLYLLDTDIDENSPQDKKITAQLYGGGLEMRLLQEILLGICGVRLLNELEIKPNMVHINEGHAAFTGIERLRDYIEKENLSYCVAKEIVKSSSLFTTHTPVPAGHDEFPEEMIRAFLPNFNEKLHLTWNQFMSLGRINPLDKSSKFSMSILAANLSQEMNGVSKIHGAESEKMFDRLYPGYFAQESHISYVTNGVHLPFWVGTKWSKLYKEFLDEKYYEKQLDKTMWSKIYEVKNKDIWNLRSFYRKKMVEYLKDRLKDEMISRNESPRVIFKMMEGLRDDVLTIGFARRFATYKRALLIFKNIDRLKEIVNDKDRPVQIIFAGKAHPNDKAGQDLIKRVIEISKSPEFIGKVFFVENYDITLAKYLVQGVDVWLNNPTRPLEASGTSGEKAIMNGVLNLSVLDGWWAEGYVEGAGWALKEERTYENQEFQDSLDAMTIYNLLEDEIQPAFYDRDKDNIPDVWVEMIKKDIAEIVPNFTMKRMIEEYDNKFYKPQIKRTKEISDDNYKIAGEIVDWKNKILEKWDDITILGAEYPDSNIRPLILGEKLNVKLKLDLDGLDPEDIGVEILLGRKKPDGT